MSRRLRLLLSILAGVLLAMLLALGTALYLLRPDSFTALLQDQASKAGLELTLASPASPTLFPRPSLELQGLTLSAKGANTPILLASRGRLALPWRSLLGGPTVITQLEIDAPRVDLGALQSWLSDLPGQPGQAVPAIPRIDTGISVVRGSLVRGNSVLLDDVSLEAGSLTAGQTFPLDIVARNADSTAMRLHLSAIPRTVGDALQLDDIALRYSHGATSALQLTGHASWHGAANAALELSGKLDRANAETHDTRSYDIRLALTPANQHDPLLFALKMDGPDNHADVRLPPLALADWWSQLDSSHGPELTTLPGSGHLEMSKLDVAGIHIEGLTVQTGDDAPASASSVTASNNGTPAQ